VNALLRRSQYFLKSECSGLAIKESTIQSFICCCADSRLKGLSQVVTLHTATWAARPFAVRAKDEPQSTLGLCSLHGKLFSMSPFKSIILLKQVSCMQGFLDHLLIERWYAIL
jgi:hypothetical protein